MNLLTYPFPNALVAEDAWVFPSQCPGSRRCLGIPPPGVCVIDFKFLGEHTSVLPFRIHLRELLSFPSTHIHAPIISSIYVIF